MRKFLFLLLGFVCVSFFTNAYAVTPKKWTFLIFINGNNNLDSFGKKNIISMEKVGSDDQVNVVVQWASASARTTKRLLIQKSNDPTQVTSPVLEDMGSVDMGDYQTLQEFIRWGVQNFPAEHYFVDVWDHGGGWHFKNLRGGKNGHGLNDISWDEFSGNCISTEQLGRVMIYAAKVIGHKVDIFGSDACLMAMAEVANEMPKSVKYFVGSEETEPGLGWPYTQLLSRWEETPNARADQISKILVEEYVKAYSGGVYGTAEVTFSAFNMAKLAQFNKTLGVLASDLRTLNPEGKAKVIEIGTNTQAFALNDYRDVGDFVKLLDKAQLKEIKSTDIIDVQNALNDLVIGNAGTSRYKKATGLAFWLPTNSQAYNEYARRYNNLLFNVATLWGDTLGYLLQGAKTTKHNEA